MAEEAKKKGILEILNETLQWFIFGGLIFKKGAPPPTGPGGQPEVELPKVPAWIVSKFHFLTTEDEQEYAQILDAFDPDPARQTIFFSFKNHLVLEGYDEDHLRIRLVNLNRDWLNRKDAKKTDIPNSAIMFVKHVVSLDGNYDAQKKLAEEKKFLEKTGRFKKFMFWGRKNKAKFLAVIFLYFPAVVVIMIYLIMRLIFS